MLSRNLRITVLGTLNAVRSFADNPAFESGPWAPKSIAPEGGWRWDNHDGPNGGKYLPAGFPQEADPVITPGGTTVRAWWQGNDSDWKGEAALSAQHPDITVTVIGEEREGPSLQLHTYKAGETLYQDAYEGEEARTVLLYLPEADALHLTFGQRSIRSGQLGWLMRGLYARSQYALPFTIVSHAPDTAANRGAFERLVHRISGEANSRATPEDVLTVTQPRTSRRSASFTLPLDTRIHLIASRTRRSPQHLLFMEDFMWDLADLQADHVTLWRYAADIAGTPEGTSALLDALPDLARATAEQRRQVDQAFAQADCLDDENEAQTGLTDPALAELNNTHGAVELALRMAWLLHGRTGPMPSVQKVRAHHEPLATSAPALNTWDDLTQLLAGHLTYATAGGSTDSTNVTAEGPGNRYIQFLCSGGDDILAEVVGPEYIDAGPDFFTPAVVNRLAGVGFIAGAYGGNFGRTYDPNEWEQAATDASSILRDLLEVVPAEVTVRTG